MFEDYLGNCRTGFAVRLAHAETPNSTADAPLHMQFDLTGIGTRRLRLEAKIADRVMTSCAGEAAHHIGPGWAVANGAGTVR